MFWKRKSKSQKQFEQEQEEAVKLKLTYRVIWAERPHRSQLSGKFLGNEMKSIFFHHILPKNSFKDLRFSEDNIILLTFEEHQKVEQDPNAFEKINRLREELQTKYV